MGEISDAADFIDDKGIVLIPLRSGSGIRIKTLEAMAAGKLVISTSIGIQGIDAQNKVHFLLANTPEEFADCFDWIIHNKEEASQIISNAQSLIREEYSQSALMQRHVHFVERLL